MESPQDKTGGRLHKSLAWCRRNPVIAALAVTVMLQLVVSLALTTYYALRLEHARQEHEGLRRELDSLRLPPSLKRNELP